MKLFFGTLIKDNALIRVFTQRANDVEITSNLRRLDGFTLNRRQYVVISFLGPIRSAMSYSSRRVYHRTSSPMSN